MYTHIHFSFVKKYVILGRNMLDYPLERDIRKKIQIQILEDLGRCVMTIWGDSIMIASSFSVKGEARPSSDSEDENVLNG